MTTIARLSALVALAAPCLAQRELPRLAPPFPVDDQFGYSIDADNGWVVVGAPLGAGRVRVFDEVTGAFVKALNYNGHEFGRAVAIHGDRVVVGQPQFDAGVAHVFDVPTGDRLYTLSQAAGDWFGAAVAISDRYVVVGSSRTGSYTGTAFVYDAQTGAKLWRLEASDKSKGDGFGWSVAVDGDLCLVGALWALPAGAAYLYDLTTGAELGKLEPSGANAHRFGARVELDTGLAVVSDEEWSLNHDNGALYVYDVATRVELRQIRGGAPDVEDFGRSLDIRDGEVIAGAAETSSTFGVAYVFDLATGDLLRRLVACDVVPGDDMGWDVALGNGGRAYVGAPASRVEGPDALGTVFRFDEDVPIGSVYCSPSVPNSKGTSGVLSAWGSDVLGDLDLVFRADELRASQFGYLLASLTQGFVAQPGNSEGNLCLGGAIGRFVKQTESSGGWRTICVRVGLPDLPPPLGVVQPGETWNFQVWYRDGASSNFTDAVAVTLQ